MSERAVESGEFGRGANDKSPDAFRTISEVADDLDLPQHVLRFWETRFSQIRPLKRGGGRRYYRRDDVELLRGIRQLLYGQGYTIKGVQRIIKQDGARFVQAIGRGETGAAPPPPSEDASLAPDDVGSQGEPAVAQEVGPALSQELSPGLGLAAADVKLLRSALEELLECRRVLAALRAEPDGEEVG